jgi:hypothetical protein
MSKTNVKKPKFKGRAARFWINKIRLYVILHGLNQLHPWTDTGNWSPCGVCKESVKIGRASNYCKMASCRKPRWLIKTDYSDMKLEKCGEHEFGYWCAEWIKDV